MVLQKVEYRVPVDGYRGMVALLRRDAEALGEVECNPGSRMTEKVGRRLRVRESTKDGGLKCITVLPLPKGFSQRHRNYSRRTIGSHREQRIPCRRTHFEVRFELQ